MSSCNILLVSRYLFPLICIYCVFNFRYYQSLVNTAQIVIRVYSLPATTR